MWIRTCNGRLMPPRHVASILACSPIGFRSMMHVSGSGETTCSSIRAPAVARSGDVEYLARVQSQQLNGISSLCHHSLLKDVRSKFENKTIHFRATDVLYIASCTSNNSRGQTPIEDAGMSSTLCRHEAMGDWSEM